MFDFSEVKNYDSEIAQAMEDELTRQPCIQGSYGGDGKSSDK